MCPNEWTDAAIFLALLGDASSLAHLVAEVVQLGATDATMTDDLELGDLVFFNNTYTTGAAASHVGIYIGNGKIIHARYSVGKITIDSLSASYYASRYVGAKRIA